VPRARLLLALAALAALAGCGGTAAARRPTDAQIAHRAGLTLRDLPSGWQRHGTLRRADCPAFLQVRRTASALAESGEFAAGHGLRQIAGAVFVFKRAASAQSAFANLSSPATRHCYASRLRALAPAAMHVRLRGVTDFVTRVDPLGDQQAGSRFVVAYATSRGQGVFYIDVLVVRAGRGIATEYYTSDSAPLDGGLRYNLTALTARRLADGLGG
jgi:hypothetical protein